MNTSQYMDKQIMDLSNSNNLQNNNNNDFIDLMNPPQEDNHHIGGGGYVKKEEIVPNYDFQPIRPITGPQSQPPPSSYDVDSSDLGGTRAWNSADSKINPTAALRNYGSLDSCETAKVILEKDHNVVDAALVSEIDRTMKKYADSLLHALEAVSARLSQLESRTRHLENSVDDLKVFVGNNHGSTDGKMRQLENILREVHNGVQNIMDKQEIMDAQLQLVKLHDSKVELQAGTQNTMFTDSVQQTASAPEQYRKQLPPVAYTQPPPTVSPPNAPPPTPQQNLPIPVQIPNQFTQNQIPSVAQQESYFPPPAQLPDAQIQQYQMPPPQQMPPPPPAPPQQQYQLASHQQYSQPPLPHPSLSGGNLPTPQTQPPPGHHPEETPYIPSQSYPPGIRQPPSRPPSGAPASPPFYGTPSHMYEPPSSRPPSSDFSGAYGGSSSGPGEPYPLSGMPNQYGSGSNMIAQQLSSHAMSQSGGGAYPQLPTARILPHALPTTSGVGGGSGSNSSGNKVPIDDVVDKVTHMGFSRDQVRATVRKLTENGQSVDLNVVLDKLMNDGEGQPQRAWFGR